MMMLSERMERNSRNQMVTPPLLMISARFTVSIDRFYFAIIKYKPRRSYIADVALDILVDIPNQKFR